VTPTALARDLFRRWNVWELERRAREHASKNVVLDEERAFLLQYLRDYADAEGLLPSDFDSLVRQSFGDLVAASLVGVAPEPEPVAAEPEPETAGVAELEADPAEVPEHEPEPAPSAAAPSAAASAAALATRPRKRLDLAKTVLVFAILVGLSAYVMGGSTFATFTGETGNRGNGFASGTLTLTDQVNSLTACDSYGSASDDNYNPACNAALTLTNLAPGVVGGQSKLTIANNGSIDASLFSVFAPYVNATLNASIGSGATIGTGQSVTSFTVTPLEGPVSTGDTIVLDYKGVTQQFCAGANAAAGAISITISGGYPAGTSGSCSGTPPTTTAGTMFGVGSRVDDTSSDTTAGNTDCSDAQTTTPGVAGATKGTDLNFNPTTNNPFCSTALLYIQEQTGNRNYCWFGRGSPYGDQGGFTEDSNGQCRTPTTMTLAANVNAATSTTTTLNGGILNGVVSLVVASSSGFPATPFTVVVDSEEMTVTNVAGTTWTVTRGVDGTIAAAHSNGATVTLMATTASLNAGTLSGNIRSGDSIAFAENGVTMTCAAGSNYYINYNSTTSPIPLTGCSTTGGTTTFDSSATVKDLSAFTALNGSNPSSTISSFDTAHHAAGPIYMPPLAGNGADSTGSSIQLAKAGGTNGVPDTRTFYVGVYFPGPGGQNQNYLQGLVSTFGLTWHIDQ
jgi:hypothetical protein